MDNFINLLGHETTFSALHENEGYWQFEIFAEEDGGEMAFTLLTASYLLFASLQI